VGSGSDGGVAGRMHCRVRMHIQDFIGCISIDWYGTRFLLHYERQTSVGLTVYTGLYNDIHYIVPGRAVPNL